LVFGAAEQVASVRESRPVLAGLGILVGVPPYMVEVQVSAHHGVDVMTADAEALQVLEKTVRKIAKHVKVASATGADAGIDYDNPLRRLHYETLEVHPLPALGRRVMRVQPLQRDHLL